MTVYYLPTWNSKDPVEVNRNWQRCLRGIQSVHVWNTSAESADSYLASSQRIVGFCHGIHSSCWNPRMSAFKSKVLYRIQGPTFFFPESRILESLHSLYPEFETISLLRRVSRGLIKIETPSSFAAWLASLQGWTTHVTKSWTRRKKRHHKWWESITSRLQTDIYGPCTPGIKLRLYNFRKREVANFRRFPDQNGAWHTFNRTQTNHWTGLSILSWRRTERPLRIHPRATRGIERPTSWVARARTIGCLWASRRPPPRLGVVRQTKYPRASWAAAGEPSSLSARAGSTCWRGTSAITRGSSTVVVLAARAALGPHPHPIGVRSVSAWKPTWTRNWKRHGVGERHWKTRMRKLRWCDCWSGTSRPISACPWRSDSSSHSAALRSPFQRFSYKLRSDLGRRLRPA